MVRDTEVKVSMVLAILVAFSTAMVVSGGEVTYDGRSLIINGERKILFSGSVHYPRSTPEMWPSIITKAKQGGIDVIQTYVFWNVHEPYEGQYNFEGRYDLVRFIKTVQDHGLYVSLRVGPFIEAEWKYGGLPIWLREIPGIVFRSDNEPFKFYMKKYVTMIVNMMKSEKLYASQGGPIILSQIENEYQLVEAAFHEKGPPYVLWAASMAVSLQTGVPWTMCKQSDAPDPVINTCNGLRCGESFQPNSPNKPSLWTENWTALFQAYGEERHKRSVEDIAFSVALFIAKNGSFVNYYMYHGGTNFGRFASAYVTTSYYDEAPIDEYGLIRQPKWGHLKELHAVIKESSDTLLSGRYTNFSLGQLQEAHVFQKETGNCVAFLVNSDGRVNVTVQFQSLTYELPPKSISILQDCMHVSFNTAEVRTQNGLRSVRPVQYFDNEDGWGAFEEGIPNSDQVSLNENLLVDQLTVTKDETDYLWYTISYDHTSSEDDQHMLNISSTAHVLHAFVNAEFIGTAHGIHRQNEGSPLATHISLKHGQNTISLLSVMVGAPDNGAYLERRFLGIRSVKVLNNQNQSVDLSDQQWGHQVGLIGERSKIYTQEGSTKTDWEPIKSSINHPLIWYKTTFDAPLGDDPVALDLSSMGKGEAYINGESIGRYWVSFLTPTEEPSQSLYHIPRSFLKPSDNLLVLFEEIGGNPLSISVNTVSVNQVCSKVSEASQSAETSRRQPVRLHLQCFEGRNISSIEFASYGSPLGDCGSYSVGGCHSFASKYIVEEACIGKRGCTVPLSAGRFRGDPCPGTSKSLAVIASCS